MKKLVFLVTLVSSIALHAQQLTQSYTFSANDVQVMQSDSFQIVSFPECSFLQNEERAGEPRLPVKEFDMLLPQGAVANNVTITVDSVQQISGSYYLYPLQLPVYANYDDPPEFVLPDSAIYSSNDPYPDSVIIEHTTNGFRDYNFTTIQFYPFRYLPLSRQLFLLTDVTITIDFTINSPIEDYKLRPYGKEDEMAYEYVKATVVNPAQTDTFYPDVAAKINGYRNSKGTGNFNGGFEPTELPLLDGSPVKYVVITNNTDVEGNPVGDFTGLFQDFVDWKTFTGTGAKIVTVDDIRQYYSGVDIAEQIREFIKKAHQLWGTEYVLLGGNSSIVPVRNVDNWLYTDLYYAAIINSSLSYNDNWNYNGNNVFGEHSFNNSPPDFCDFYADIAVGRAPVDSEDEVELFLMKNFTYNRCSYASLYHDGNWSLPDGNWLNKQLNIGGIIYEQDWPPNIPDDFNALGLPLFWYIETSFSDDSQQYTMLEELDDWQNLHPDWQPAYGVMDAPVEKTTVISKIDEKPGIIFHTDHSGPHGLGLNQETEPEKIRASDIAGLVNNEKYPVMLSGGCHTTPIEYDYYIGEQWVNSPNGGVIFIGGSVDLSPSTSYDFSFDFFTNLYDVNISTIGINKSLCHYQANKRIQLLGDPELNIYTDVSATMNVTYDNNIIAGNQIYYVTVTGYQTGEDVKICLFKEGEVYATTYTSTGNASIEITPDTPGEMFLTVTCHNAEPFESHVEGAIQVGQNSGTHLYISDITIDDDNVQPSNGNGNGIADAGEIIEIPVTLTNSGGTEAINVSAELSHDTSPWTPTYFTITQSQSGFGNIPSLGTGVTSAPFVISVMFDTPENYSDLFKLEINDGNNNQYLEYFTITNHTSSLKLLNTTITTQIPPVNVIDPDDIVEVTFEIQNTGSGLGDNIIGVITESSPHIDNILVASQSFGDISPLATGTNQNAFSFHVVDTYDYKTIQILLTLTNEYGKEWEIPVNINKPPIPGNIEWSSTIESVILAWEPIQDNVAGYNVYRSNTATGTYEKVNDYIIQGFSGFTDTDLLPGTEYFYKLSSISSFGIESERSAPVQTWTTLPYHNGWPVTEIKSDEFGGRTEGSPITADFDADGNKEIYFTTTDRNGYQGGIFGFYQNGNEIYDIDQDPGTCSGFYKYSNAGSKSTPVVGDLDANGTLEVLTTTFGETSSDDKRRLFLHSSKGDQTPDLLDTKYLMGPDFRGVTLSDINYDGDLEIIAKASGGAPINVLNYDDNTQSIINYSGWPVSTSVPYGFGLPVAANIDNSGDKELIFSFTSSMNGTNGGIYVFNSDGTSYLTGNSGLFYPTASGTYDRMDSPVTIANMYDDVNNHSEIICVSGTDDPDFPEGRVFILDDRGSTIPNWGYNDHFFTLTNSDEGRAWLPCTSVGDLNNDGDLEVLIASDDYIYIWEKDGSDFISPIYVEGLEAKLMTPLIADVDDDDDMEIIMASNGSDGKIYGFNNDGTVVFGFPILCDGIFSTPCIDDIDNDGKNELIALSANTVHVWDTEGDADKIEWGMYRHDRYNSGVYGDFCPGDQSTIYITSNTTWDQAQILQGSVSIESGATLTITANTALPEDAKIIVKPGAMLALSGAILTNACGGLWGGIEVWGDPQAIQIPAYQGRLSISYGGTVENAVVGVRVGAEYVANSGGGIIHTDEAVFRNNRTDVFYSNYAGSNLGNFTLTTFETTSRLIDGSLPDYHMYLVSVEDIRIEGCTFRNTRGTEADYSQRGTGIQSLDASYIVDEACISGTTPCTEYQETVFDSLYYGIKTLGFVSAFAPTVNNSTFKHNFRGMYLSNITLAEVTNCNFEVNNEFTTNGGYGLYLDNSTDYIVEENNFYSDMATPTGIGLIVHNSGTAPNEIYRNKFINLDQGVSAQEINRDSRRTRGLQILCCEFETCNFDILVPQSQLAGRGICYYQGANSQFAEDMAGNLFDIHGQNPDDDYDDINNQGAYFNYFYPINNDDYRVKPIDYTINTINRVGELVLYDNWSYDVDCPPSSTGGGSSESELLTNLTNVNQEISSTEQILLSLVDGGDTKALYLTVEYSMPPEATDVFNEMMETSPYLSDSVVGAAIEKENVVPDAMLRDVMVANPHSAKSEKLMEKLDNRYTPLPEYMKSQIMTSRSQVSLKERLESKLNKYRLEKKRALTALMHHYLYSDSIPEWRDSITNLLVNDNDLQSKYRLAMWQLHNGEFVQSGNTLNSIPGIFDLQGDLLTVYNDMVSLNSILFDMLSSDSCSIALTSSQVQQLTTLAQASAPASGYARNILIMTGNLAYTEPIQVPNRLKSAKAEDTYEKEFNVVVPSALEVYPNPATGYFVLGYQLDGVRDDAIVEIRNTKGELISTIPVTNEIDQQMINTDTWQAGIYIITLKQKGEIIESAKLTLMK